MLSIEARGLEDVQDLLRQAGKGLPKASAMTLTWMGQAAKQKLEQKIPSIFDRPTNWTKKSTFLKAATASSQKAIVYVKDGSIKSLEHHITGGARRPKRFERRLRSAGILPGNMYAVPGSGMKLNKYGNVPMSQINKILSAMGAQGDKYANSTSRSIQRNKGQANLFHMRRAGNIPAGIYRRSGKGANVKLSPIFVFVKQQRYSARYRFFEIADDAAYDAMPDAARRALDRLLK